MSIRPKRYEYDYSLGAPTIELNEYVKYIRESNLINARISPIRCYLLQEKKEGDTVGSEEEPITIDNYIQTQPAHIAILWEPANGDTTHPDLRPYTDSGKGQILVWKDDNPMERVLKPGDIINDDEFAVVKRMDRNDKRVEIVFNPGFDASAHTITYTYTTMNKGINTKRLKVGEDETHSLFGWEQYLNDYCDDYQDKHQILVRVPMPTRDIVIEQHGLTIKEENQCWTLWFPIVGDGDVLIIPQDQTISGIEERYEINDVQYSIIQGSLVSQRFSVILLEETDLRYKIPYITE